jgi:hypothetical protein
MKLVPNSSEPQERLIWMMEETGLGAQKGRWKTHLYPLWTANATWPTWSLMMQPRALAERGMRLTDAISATT